MKKALVLALALTFTLTSLTTAYAQWNTDGVAICTATADQTTIRSIDDGLGGSIIVWQDARSGNPDIYAQKVDNLGNVQWTADGVAICTESHNQISPRLTTDGAGGAIISWDDDRWGDNPYAQRVDAGGTTLWTADGILISTEYTYMTNYPEIASDGVSTLF